MSGLLGPNGAGKTTALRILVGLVRADAGTVTIAGEPIGLGWVAGERVGAMVATPVFYPHLSGAENLRVLAAAWGWTEARTSARIAAALGLVDLASVGERPARGYSTGMRQRLGIALALLADPPILILDEPVNGLDPAGIAEIRDLLIDLAAGGRTILVSSHLLTEVEKTCDHVTIVDRGRIVAAGTPDSLAGGGERIELRLAAGEVAAAQRALEAAGFRVTPPPDPARHCGSTARRTERPSAACSRPPGLYPDELIRRRDSLEDVFLRLTGPQHGPAAVMHLLAADRVRFGRRRDLRFVVALVPVILALMFVMEFNTAHDAAPGRLLLRSAGPRVLEADMRAQMLAEWRDRLVVELPAFAFPASLVKVAGNIGPLALLAIYLAIALVAAEFEWGTVRTLHLTSSRGRTLAVRTGVVVGMVAVATALGLVLAAIIPFLLSVEGRPLQDYAEPVPGLLSEVGVRILAVLPFVSIPILIAVLTRSMSLAFLLTVLFFVADLALTGSAQFWQASPLPWVPAVTRHRLDLATAPRVRGPIPGLAGAAVGVPGRAACLVGAAGRRRDRAVPPHRHQRIGGFPDGDRRERTGRPRGGDPRLHRHPRDVPVAHRARDAGVRHRPGLRRPVRAAGGQPGALQRLPRRGSRLGPPRRRSRSGSRSRSSSWPASWSRGCTGRRPSAAGSWSSRRSRPHLPSWPSWPRPTMA